MGEITFGNHTYGSPIRRGTGNNVRFGNYCSIAENVILDCGFNHETRFISTFPFNQKFHELNHLKGHPKIKGDIYINNDIWIGEAALIMSGVVIGDGAIIGYGSIISKDVEPYSIVVGANRVLRRRFTDRQIEKLLRIQWWNWADEKVKENAHLLMSNNIDEFINKHYDN